MAAGRADERAPRARNEGEEIPAAAAIVAVADALEAIVSERRYRGSRPLPDAIAEMVARSGTQFNPAIVDALVRLNARNAIPLETPEHGDAAQAA